ncbi:MAG TPA: PAS domain S-box protein [Candidatus Limnocylindria bacterium]|jgi:PAS domain S-box-containing protein|nr:PAS domain S-box protein [Candidatus Limnocylindria bacterium]
MPDDLLTGPDAASRLAAIVASSDDAIISKDLNGIITSWNAGAERLFGYSASEVIGQPVTIFIPPERLEEEATIIGRIRKGEPVNHFETIRRRKDGTLIEVSLTISPIIDQSGRVVGASKIARDIRERRKLEVSLAARAEELARADRAKDEFLAMLAHELRNPLAPLKNAAEILESENISVEERTQAQRIVRRQIENMTRLVDDLLDVARITRGKIELRKKPVTLEAILTAATSMVRSSCSAHHQELSVSLPKEPVYLEADATRLEQVFGNLLNNACKYSGDGSHIVLSAERSGEPEKPEVTVSVRDDGIGIAPELLPSIFGLFVQATRSLDRAYGGLGIGLTLVDQLVKLHGGSVEARSEGLGKGAEFIVRLPILLKKPAESPVPALPQGPKEKSRRMLIVDDHRDSALSMAVLQRRRGHTVRTAFTGPDAVHVAGEFLPEVVLLDLGLPEMDGFAVARKLRELPELTGAFLVALSGYASNEDRQEAEAAGFDRFMTKPADMALLRQWLTNPV